MSKKIVFLILIVISFAFSIFGQKLTKVTPKPKATLNLFNINLIKNGNAENGNGTGWTNLDELKTLLYGEFGGGPTKDSVGAPNRGERYFYVQTTTEKPTAVFRQKTDVSAIATTIDKDKVTYNFGGWFGVANGSSSAGRLKILFIDASGKELKKDETAEITEENRPPDEVLFEKNRSGNLPVGTRKIEITLEFKIFVGHEEHQDNLALADNLSLVLTEKGDK